MTSQGQFFLFQKDYQLVDPQCSMFIRPCCQHRVKGSEDFWWYMRLPLTLIRVYGSFNFPRQKSVLTKKENDQKGTRNRPKRAKNGSHFKSGREIPPIGEATRSQVNRVSQSVRPILGVCSDVLRCLPSSKSLIL